MRRRRVVSGWLACACVAYAVGGVLDAQTKATCAEVVKTLAGGWKAAQYRMKRTSAIGEQVFGPNAMDVRDVELTLQPSGEGVLRINTSVLDAKGKTWAPTRVEAKLSVGEGTLNAAGRCEPAVTVTGAQEQYLDDTNYSTEINGARVVMLAEPGAKQLELRYETPDGQGSFWTTLRRQGGR